MIRCITQILPSTNSKILEISCQHIQIIREHTKSYRLISLPFSLQILWMDAFTLKSGYDLRISSDAFIHSFWDEISEYTSALGFTFDSSLIMNICELTREYSITNIKKSLSLIRNDYADTYTSIVNFGALLRSYCRRNFIRPAA